MDFTMEKIVKHLVTVESEPRPVTALEGVSARLGGRGPSVTQTLMSVPLVPRVPEPIGCVRTPPDHTSVSVKRAIMKPHLAIAQVCIGCR